MTQLALIHPTRLPRAPLTLPPTELARQMGELAMRAILAAVTPKQLAIADAPLSPTVEEELALKRSQAKSLARRYVMLFEADWLPGLSRQIDALLDTDEWIEGDDMLSLASFSTLLSVMMALRNYRRPGIGLTPEGNVLAAWSRSAKDRLIVECLPTGRVKWMATAPMPAGNESGSLDTTPERLLETLAPFNPVHWLEAI